ncbi:ABC transporter ATP-binding protein [Paracoccus sp. (in: a-proteobacteria)]|uniref:ABC transporter ATP-binding protein n=1 Tax=Paracoccus sp. TaxID=267 RepID=UPI003A855AA3
MQLEITALKSGYGKVQILHGLDMSVPPAQITAVLGPNGAGKSTLMKTIAGHLPVMSGDITLGGRAIANQGPLQVCRQGLGYVPQERNVFADLSVRDNLRASSVAFDGADARVAEVFDRFPILDERADQVASTLSGGERQTLAIAMALVAGPQVLILDEPTAGLAPIFVDRIVAWVRELAADGMGVIWVVEQDPEKILAVSGMAHVIDAGRNAQSVKASDLLRPGRLEEVLLQSHA